MRTVVTAERLLTPLTEIDHPVVTIEDGQIAMIASRGALEMPADAQHLDFPDTTLVPSFLDVHTHGAMGHDVMEGTSAALDAIGGFLARHGVGAYLPTTMTAPVETILHALEGVADYIEPGANTRDAFPGARPLGVHLEGPFLSHEKRGVHPPHQLQRPAVELLHRFWQASRGHIVLMTVAPELPGASECIAAAAELGIRISLGHSNATTQEALHGIAAGASSATHTFNAMRPLDHREPGLLGVVLDETNLFAELICDGIHVDPVLVRLFYKSKCVDRGILITDAMSATGMPDGPYKLGALEVTVADGRCLYEGKLAGSVLTLDRAVRNFLEYTQAPYSAALQYASTNPAALTGCSQSYGELAPGRPANITVLSSSGEVRNILLNGQVFAA
ncbi:MAG: N-acetylglucosamine-6-phosphate deacetylase [Acidobacteriaceae bacterium]